MTTPEPKTELKLCDCHSYNWDIGTVPERIVNGVCLDECIADAVEELWRQGLETIGSCCGHNRITPSLVIPNEADPQKYLDALAKIDGRNWSIYQWERKEYTRAPVEASHESEVDVLKAFTRLTNFLVECHDPDFTPTNIYSADEIGDFQTDLLTLKNQPQSSPKAGQVDVEAIVNDLIGWAEGNADSCFLRDVVHYLSTQGYFGKPIAGLRERILAMKEPVTFGGRACGKTWKTAVNTTIDSVIELIDRGA